MTVLAITQVGNPVLRRPAREVGVEELASPEIQRLIDDMITTKRDANGAGIAAPQIDESLRIAVVEVGDNPRYPYKPRAALTVIVNPTIEYLGEERYLNNEGCLSVPSIRGELYRHVAIRVRALDRHGEPFVREVRGLTAGTFQHEVDHLEGKLFLDRVDDARTFATWDEFHDRYESEFVERIAPLVVEDEL